MPSRMTEAPTLPDRIKAWIASDGGAHALVLITVDGFLRPHLMLLARDQVVLAASDRLRVAVGPGSQTDTNLGQRSTATLAIYDAGLACVIKTRVSGGPRALSSGGSAWDLAVEDVRFDSPTREEAAARLVSGLRFEGRAERPDIREELARLDGRDPA